MHFLSFNSHFEYFFGEHCIPLAFKSKYEDELPFFEMGYRNHKAKAIYASGVWLHLQCALDPFLDCLSNVLIIYKEKLMLI